MSFTPPRESFDSAELDDLAAGLTKMECSPVRRHAARRRTAHFGQVTPGDVGESPGQSFFSTPERAASPEAMMDMHEAPSLPEAPALVPRALSAANVKAREDKAAAAEVNRVKHGTPKAVSDLAKARAEMAAKTLDGHRRDDGE